MEERPIEIPDNATPAMFHQPYPFALEDRITPWRAENGLNWIDDSPNGEIVIIPSGGGIHLTFEESQSSTTQVGKGEFTAEDIDAFESELNRILAYVNSDRIYTYYVSWSFGQALDKSLLEEWQRMVSRYVEQGKVQWKTMPEIYYAYVNWESRNRNQ